MIVHGGKDERNHLYFNRLSSKLSGTALIDYYRLKFILRRFFCVEHLAKASRRRSLRLVRTVPGHLMRTSRAKFEFSEAGICRALNESKLKAQLEFICKAEENPSEL